MRKKGPKRQSPTEAGDWVGAYRSGYFDSEMFAALNWLSALMLTVCLLPAVRSVMLALKPAVTAVTWKLPPPPRPERLPLMARLVSLHYPVIAPP